MTSESKGLIDIGSIKHTIPVGAELYPPGPIVYTDVEAIAIPYRTTLEAARSMLPSIIEVEEPATAILSMLKIHRSTIGQFREAQITLRVTYRGEPRRFNLLMMTTSDSSLSYGREVLGAPKKLGHIDLVNEQEGVVGYAQRPRGMQLISASVQPTVQVEANTEALNMTPSLGLRVIENPHNSAAGDRTIELVETAAEWTIREQWEGPAALSFPAQSSIDPFHVLPVEEILTGMYTRLQVKAPHPTVVETLS